MTTCHKGPSGQRMAGSSHPGPHDECAECAATHCVVCGRTHLDEPTMRTCPQCIGETRDDLAAIPELYIRLRTHTWVGGQDGRLEAARPIPGGDAMVMLAPGSDGTSSPADESWGDPVPPLLTLASWEDDWRHTFGHKAAEHLASVGTAVAYLDRHLDYAAQHHDAFDEFASDIEHLRRSVEDLTHAGKRDDTGAPCVHCRARLVHDWHREGKHDEWRCPRCRRTYSEDGYRYAVGAAYRAHATALTATDMERQHDIPPGLLRVWAGQGHVRRRGRNDEGRVLYDVEQALAQRDTSTSQTTAASGTDPSEPPRALRSVGLLGIPMP